MSKTYDIDALLEEVVTLPSLPGTVAQLMKLVSDPQCSLSAVARAVAMDPGLAMKTLRLVNSAYYGVRQQIATIEHAVVLLGIRVIKNLAFTATVFDVMKGSPDAFLRHSVMCGLAMRVLAEPSSKESFVEAPEEALVYGLLHDVGKVILAQFLPEEHAQIAEISRTRNVRWHEAERQIIGVDHAELGARLAQQWKLPERLIEGIAGHHDLDQCTTPALKRTAAMLTVANYLCYACGVTSYEGCIGHVSDEAWAASQLTSAEVPLLLDRLFEELPLVGELIEVAV